MSDELKPCPFCGGDAVLRTTIESPDYFEAWYTVHCDMCGVKIGAEYKSDAISHWNKRMEASDGK